MSTLIWARLDARIAHDTEKATCFKITGSDQTIWIPHSQLHGIEYDRGGDAKDVMIGERVRSVKIPEWLADKNDLDRYGD